MARAQITLNCGRCGADYTAERFFHSRSEANDWEAYMSSQDGLCRECYADEQRALRVEKKAADRALAAQCPLALPKLTGSPKQIAWAEDIRGSLIVALTEQGIRWDVIVAGKYPAEIKAEVDTLFEPLSKVWIEMRGETILGTRVR